VSERRLKIAFVSKDLFLEVFGALAKREVILLPVTDELPDGTELVRVYEDFQRGMWGMVLRHDSFPIVPDGSHIEVLNNPYLPLWGFKRVSLNKTHDMTNTAPVNPNHSENVLDCKDLGVRVRKTLARLGIDTYGKLAATTPKLLTSQPNFGITSLWKVREALQEKGLTLLNDKID
jgi:hypothetical protein